MKKIIALLLCTLLLLNGCRPASGPLPSLPPQGGEPETRTDEEILAAGEEAGEDIRAIFPDATFKTNKAGAASLDYAGEAAQLSVTDDAGLNWTLSIPEDALAVPTTITMTPLADVSDGRGSRSGVRFGPDGLVFLTPATLTLTGPGADKVLLLYADESGRDMTPASFMPGEDGALLFHFSSAFADSFTGDPAEDAEFMKQADELYDQYYDKARKLLDKQIKPPKPMKLELKCFNDNALEEIEAQVVRAVKEEITYATALWIALGAAMMREDAARAMELHRVIQGLTQRALQKLEMMISLDNPKPETYFYAVKSFTAHLGLVGINTIAYAGNPDFVKADPLGQAKEWLNTFVTKTHAAGEYTWRYLLDGIARDHEYRYILTAMVAEVLMQGTGKAALLANRQSGGEADTQNRRQQLSDACTFTIYFEGTTMNKRDGVAKWSTSAEGKLPLQQFLDSKVDAGFENYLLFKGEAQGTYDHYSSTDPAAAKVLLTKEFTTEVFLALGLPCCLTAWAGTAQFGARDLTYQTDDGDVTVPSGIQFFNQLALGEYYDPQLRAVMPGMTLTPGKALAQKKIDGKLEYSTIDYTIFLEHTPELGGR